MSRYVNKLKTEFDIRSIYSEQMPLSMLAMSAIRRNIEGSKFAHFLDSCRHKVEAVARGVQIAAPRILEHGNIR
jgi:hypothetical protein